MMIENGITRTIVGEQNRSPPKNIFPQVWNTNDFGTNVPGHRWPYSSASNYGYYERSASRPIKHSMCRESAGTAGLAAGAAVAFCRARNSVRT
jgi:hypothetical protein